MRQQLTVVLSLLATLLGVGFVVGGVIGVFATGGHPVLAGRGRIHDAKTVETPCQHINGVCDRAYDVQLDEPGGRHETIDDLDLYVKVDARGPQVVDVEWDSKLHEATRVRLDGRWFRVGHPSEVNVFSSVLLLLGGLVLGAYGLIRCSAALRRSR